MNDSTERRHRSIDADIDYFVSRFQPRGRSMRNRWDRDSTLSGWRMGPSPTTTRLRVSDAERNEVADRLSSHFAEGRLDQAEFKERLDSAMSAKTQGDLSGLFDDLPPLATQPRPEGHPRRRRLVPFLVLVAILAVAAGSTFPTDRWFHVPWLLIAVVGVLFWHRVVGHHRRHTG
jgi:hypothetical protein